MRATSKSLPMRVTAVCAVAAALAVTAPTANAHAADPPRTTRVSVGTGGTQADGASTSPQVSANGRYVAFLSNASNLVSGDTNGIYDVFLHDRNTGRTELVSRGLGGAAANDASRPPRMSANGRYVVFYSFATNLVGGDTNRAPDTFIYDRITKAVSIVPVGAMGSVDPDVSADGRFISLVTVGKLVSEDENPGGDVYVYDTVHADVRARHPVDRWGRPRVGLVERDVDQRRRPLRGVRSRTARTSCPASAGTRSTCSTAPPRRQCWYRGTPPAMLVTTCPSSRH